jgi:hypothetical protein
LADPTVAAAVPQTPNPAATKATSRPTPRTFATSFGPWAASNIRVVHTLLSPDRMAKGPRANAAAATYRPTEVEPWKCWTRKVSPCRRRMMAMLCGSTGSPSRKAPETAARCRHGSEGRVRISEMIAVATITALKEAR